MYFKIGFPSKNSGRKKNYLVELIKLMHSEPVFNVLYWKKWLAIQ